MLSLAGNIALEEEGRPQAHAHAVLGRSGGTMRGGHLLKGRVHPTLEVVLSEASGHLRRRMDEETDPPLIDVEIGSRGGRGIDERILRKGSSSSA